MLTQGPAPHPNCKLNISPFLTLTHLLDCLVCNRNAMSIVLLLQLMGGWARWGLADLCQGEGGGIFLVFVFCCLTFSVPLFRWLERDGWCVCFFVFSLFSSSLIPLSKRTSAEKLLCKTISKVSRLIIILWVSLEKGECFDFSHSLGCVQPTLYIGKLLGRVYHFRLLICCLCSSLQIENSIDEYLCVNLALKQFVSKLVDNTNKTQSKVY